MDFIGNKVFRIAISLVVAGIFIVSCLEEPEFPSEPFISYNNVLFKDLENEADSLIILIDFQDGDGNLGLRKDEIPLGARILCVSEVFDTLVNAKSYRPTKSRREALAELETNAETRYDGKVVRAFAEVLREESAPAETTISASIH